MSAVCGSAETVSRRRRRSGRGSCSCASTTQRTSSRSEHGSDRQRSPAGRRTKGSGRAGPNMSPDGNWITSSESRRRASCSAVFADQPDGSGLHRLTPFKWEVAIERAGHRMGNGSCSRQTPTGSARAESANLVTIRPDGSGLKRLTRFAGGEHAMNGFAGSYSPDGRRIVFRLEKHDKGALATIGRDGRHLRLLTKFSNNGRGTSTGARPHSACAFARQHERHQTGMPVAFHGTEHSGTAAALRE